uniref:Uncharacterized protein n=1 Tax=Setaria italica TaxID=4555 RepID=K3ZZ00_SETIT
MERTYGQNNSTKNVSSLATKNVSSLAISTKLSWKLDATFSQQQEAIVYSYIYYN